MELGVLVGNLLSRSGFRDLVKQVISDAKLNFVIQAPILYKEKTSKFARKRQEEYFDYYLSSLEINCCILPIGRTSHPYFVEVRSDHDSLDRAAMYIVESLKNAPMIKTTLQVHNPANMKWIAKPIVTKEKEMITEEVVKEKEVIIKIRCPYCLNAYYCQNTYNKELDKCPHCGRKT